MSKTIITVGDSATMRNMISVTLKGAGHEVLQAGDRVEALTLLNTRRVDIVNRRSRPTVCVKGALWRQSRRRPWRKIFRQFPLQPGLTAIHSKIDCASVLHARHDSPAGEGAV